MSDVYVPPDPIVYLWEITVYDPDLPGTKILRYCTGEGCVVGGYFYEPMLRDPGNIIMMIFAEGKTWGQSTIGYGEGRLVNVDGSLDGLRKYGYGRQVVIKQLIAGVAVLLASCSSEQPTFNIEEVAIRIKDPAAVIDVPIQANKYQGNNPLPNGTEGTADIEGKEKPLMYGTVVNGTPVCVNTSKLIYQVNDGAVNTTGANVYDRGVKLTRGADYVSQADMEANPPVEGSVRWWPGSGYFRLGTLPTGQVTFDAVEGATAADRTAGQISQRIALRVITAGDLVDQTFVDLDTANSDEIGIYITQGINIPPVLDEVLGSIGGWWGFDTAGKLNVGRLEAPAGDPVVTLTDVEIIDLDHQATQDEGRGVPAWQVNVNYAKNYTVQSTDLAGSVKREYTWVQRTLPASVLWSSVAYGNGMFCAVGFNTAIAATSQDGITWTQRTLPANTSWKTVAFGNGMFVAVTNGTIGASSPDGITWTQRTLPGAGPWGSGVTYGNGVFVALGYNTAIAATSPDGITWTQRTLPITAQWKAVAYGNGLFVAVANNSDFAVTSPNGITWTQRTLPGTGNIWNGLTYGNSGFVALAFGYQLAATSPDGITWTQRTLPINANWQGVAYGNGLYLAVSSSTTISAGSPDGITWTKRELPTVAFWQSVAYGGGIFVTISSSSNNIAATYSDNLLSGTRGFLEKEYRSVSSTDATVKTAHPLASSLTFYTLLIDKAAAQAEADRQLAMRKVPRDYLDVPVHAYAVSTIPAPCAVVNMIYPRYDYNAGKLFRFLGNKLFLEKDEIVMKLWG